tara:strand:- start:3981 stop:5057 length:1077 start_codon:yes stop_codon:yes gene_type:complete
MALKKVSIVGGVGLPANYGGWETLSSNLTQQLSSQFEMTVFCSSKKYEFKLKEFNGAKLKYINLNANGIQSIPYDIISIYKSLKFADTILILGVSGCIFLPFVRLFGDSQIIVNIDGLEWKRDKWGLLAGLFLRLSEKIAVKYADMVIADNKAIQNYILDKYKISSTMIPYGGDHAKKQNNGDLTSQYSFIKSDYAFSVCRIEPENNIEEIIKAFYSFKNYPLVIVGNWSNSSYGSKLKLRYQNLQNLHLLDPIYSQVKLDSLRSNCSIYIHGHSAGGTNPSLVEAMNLGLAIFAYDVCYNRETTLNKALYFKESNQLFKILTNIESIDLNKIRFEMKAIAQDKYSWLEVSKKYAKLF